MPCDSGGYDLSRVELDRVVRILCEVLGKVRVEDLNLSHDALAWWEDHQRKDAARRKKEQDQLLRLRRREEALAKLTPAERAALFERD